MNKQIAVVLSLLAVLAGLTACGGSTAPAGVDPTTAAPTAPTELAGLSLPRPGDVLRQGSANAQQRFRRGPEYVPNLKGNAGTEDATTALFEPEYNGVTEFSPAYLIYDYFLPDYTAEGAATVYFDDGQALPPDGNVWLGFADGDADAWRWYAVDTGSEPPSSIVPVTSIPITDYISDQGDLLACLLCIGTTTMKTKGLLIGAGLGPVAVPVATDSIIESDTVTTLNGTASFSEFSTITAWDWDLDGDGVFDESGGIIDPVELPIGEHAVTLRVTDDNGLTDSADVHVLVWDTLNPPDYFEVEDNDTLATAQQLPGLPLSGFTGNCGPGGVHGDGQDWYELTHRADGQLTVMLWFVMAEADLGLELYDQYGAPVQFQDTAGSPEVLTTQLQAGRYFLLVRSAEGEPGGADYALDFIPSFFNEAPVAFLAMQSALVQGQEVTLHGNQSYDFDGTVDEYQWDLYGDGDFERTTVESSTTYTVNRVGDFTARLRVTDNGGAWGEYEVPFTVGGDQQYDEMEDNDTEAGAMALSWFPDSGTPTFVGDIGEGGGFDGDVEDIFSFQLVVPGNVQWILNTLDPEHAALQISLVYVDGGNSHMLDIDDSGNPVLAISKNLTETAGTYYLHVTPQHGSSRYDFSLHFTP